MVVTVNQLRGGGGGGGGDDGVGDGGGDGSGGDGRGGKGGGVRGGGDGEGFWHVYMGASAHSRTNPSSDRACIGQLAGSLHVHVFTEAVKAHTWSLQHMEASWNCDNSSIPANHGRLHGIPILSEQVGGGVGGGGNGGSGEGGSSGGELGHGGDVGLGKVGGGGACGGAAGSGLGGFGRGGGVGGSSGGGFGDIW